MVVVVSPVEYHHAVRYKFEFLQKVLIVHLGCRDLYEPSNRLYCIDEHMDFQSPFLLAIVLRVTTHTFENVAKQPDGGGIDQ